MFVKILQTVDGKDRVDIHECSNASSWFGKDPKIMCLQLDMQLRLDVEVDGAQIYYLNELGQTIDRIL